MLYLNDKPVEFGQFPNKEINLPIKELDIKEVNTVSFDYVDDSDIFKLITLKNFLDSMNGQSDLYISYLPYSRMDRANGVYAISLYAIADIINHMNFKTVTIREPHSDTTLETIKNLEVDWWCSERIERVASISGANSIFYPDAGAQNRYAYKGLPVAVGFKKRSFATGNIEKYAIKGNVGKNILIVDDLCSRGGTFINASKLLREKGAQHIELLVAHCENNVFTGNVFDYIDRIYTSREMLDKDHPRITKID